MGAFPSVRFVWPCLVLMLWPDKLAFGLESSDQGSGLVMQMILVDIPITDNG